MSNDCWDRKAGNTLGVGGDPAKGAAAGEGVRPMYPRDYIELCRMIGQDAIALEALVDALEARAAGRHRGLDHRPQHQDPR